MAMARDVRSDKTRLTFQLIKKDSLRGRGDDNRPLMYTCILDDKADEKWSRFLVLVPCLSSRS